MDAHILDTTEFYDGCSDGRNIAGLLRACMAFGKMVPEAGGRRGVSAGKKAARRIHKCWYWVGSCCCWAAI